MKYTTHLKNIYAQTLVRAVNKRVDVIEDGKNFIVRNFSDKSHILTIPESDMDSRLKDRIGTDHVITVAGYGRSGGPSLCDITIEDNDDYEVLFDTEDFEES